MLLSACQTTTRLGDIFIPAHPASNKAQEEKVEIEIQKRSGDQAFAIGALVLPAAKWLADEAQKKIAEEIRNEAKKYTQQYAGKFRDKLEIGIHDVVMYRLIPGTDRMGPQENSLSTLHTWIQKREDKAQADTKKPMIVASAIRFELMIGSESDGKQAFGYMDIKEIYLSHAKAKVVGLSAWPWHWIGGILLKTGDLVKFEVHAKVKGWTDKGPMVVIDEDFPAGGQKLRLGSPLTEASKNVGDWILFGQVVSISGKKFVPLTLELRVTETDPSNVQKLLNEGAEKVEKSSDLKDLLP